MTIGNRVAYGEAFCETKEKLFWFVFYKKYFNIELEKDFKLDIPLGYNSKIHTNVFIPKGLIVKQALNAIKRAGVNIIYSRTDELTESDDRDSNSSYSVFFSKDIECKINQSSYSAEKIWSQHLNGTTFLEMLILWLRTYVEGNGTKLNCSIGVLCTGTRLFGHQIPAIIWVKDLNEGLKIYHVSCKEEVKKIGVRLVNE